MMSSSEIMDNSEAQGRFKKILDRHQIPSVQPTDGLILSHIGTPPFTVLSKKVRQDAGPILLMIRVILFTLSMVLLFLALQQEPTGNTLSGEPWGPLEQMNWPLVSIGTLLSAYVLIPITFVIGVLILSGLDMQVTWLFNNKRYRVGQWIIYSTILWFGLSIVFGILIEATITWSVRLFPELSQQIYVVLLGGAVLTNMGLAVLLLSATREFIRQFRPDLIRIEGRIVAVRDFLTGRKFMRWPFTGFSGSTSSELTHFFFVRESIVNWTRAGVLIASSIGFEYLLSLFAPAPFSTPETTILAFLVGIVIVGLGTNLVLHRIRSGTHSYQSAFLAISSIAIAGGVALTLMYGLISAVFLNLFAVFCLSFVTYKIRSFSRGNSAVFNPTYYRTLLEISSPAESHRFVIQTLDELESVLSSLS
ncbi:MAG: hypothetical protein K9W43_03230 [Candidatus Thorarchaeota archaeon]|nr:hypothetical protein [Candidatus Thorarchaeota archaeon]